MNIRSASNSVIMTTRSRKSWTAGTGRTIGFLSCSPTMETSTFCGTVPLRTPGRSNHFAVLRRHSWFVDAFQPALGSARELPPGRLKCCRVFRLRQYAAAECVEQTALLELTCAALAPKPFHQPDKADSAADESHACRFRCYTRPLYVDVSQCEKARILASQEHKLRRT